MGESEKKYKIEKLEKYSGEWKKSKERIENMFIIGTISLAALFGGIGNIIELLYIPSSYTKDCLDISSIALVGMGTQIGFTSIKELINSIAEKTNIENRIDKINEELDLLQGENINQSRGGR